VIRAGLSALLVALAAASVAVAAPDPRDEREQLTPGDTALAKRIVLRRSDLPVGWKAVPTPPDDDEPFSCAGFEPDFSAFTVTGKAETAFDHREGSSLLALAQVFPTRAQAVGDFRTGAKPALARCLRLLLQEQLDEQKTQGTTNEITSSRMVREPRLGERAAAYRTVVRVRAGGQTAHVYLDLLVFQQGRSLGVVMAIGVLEPVALRAQLAAKMVSRMQ
jgi:hypothetical protein